MSVDEQVTKDLIETLEDGKQGFTDAAEHLADSGHADLVSKFKDFASQRAEFASELRQIAGSYGDKIDEQGSVGAAVHRGWMKVKDSVSGNGAKGVLAAAEQGEDHTMGEYEKALENDDISPQLRQVIARQSAKISAAHDEVRALRDSA